LPSTETIATTSTPAAPTLTKTDSSCTSSTGSIEVTAPLGTGFTYSIDGTTYQTSPIFSSLSPKSYNITVKNSSGCVSLPATETIATTSTPLAPTLKKTDSSCTSSTGSIEVTAPLGTGFTYSIDGTTYQSSPIFSSLSPKSYNITVKNSSGCVSLPAIETIATIATPAAPILSKTNPTCTVSTGSIQVNSPLGAGFTYSIDGTTYQTSPIFSSLSPKSYNITVKNSSGCVSLPAVETISTVSRIDPINSVQYICFDKTGLLIAPVIIDTKLSPTDYSFVWTFAGSPISITSSSYVATAVGIYKITATSKTGGCTILFNADVKESKEAIAVATVGNDFDTQQQIIVTVTGGLGNYEYQLDDGLPQSNPILFVSKSGDYTVKVIDKLGCNNFLLPVNVLNFPRFFTPNNDGYNDTWNIEGLNKPEKAIIYIFDRYGKLLKQISPVSKGWDGVYNGVAQPASDYWFRLLYQDSTGANKEFKAHFSLKR
jgi:gliding motility-associated-like protein